MRRAKCARTSRQPDASKIRSSSRFTGESRYPWREWLRVKTSVLVLAGGGRTEHVMFLHADHDGFKLDANHDQPIEADDLPGLIAAFNRREKFWEDWQARDGAAPWTEKWWFATAEAIEREDWNLSASRYRPESREAAEHRDPRELLAELRDEIAAILADIDALSTELGAHAA